MKLGTAEFNRLQNLSIYTKINLTLIPFLVLTLFVVVVTSTSLIFIKNFITIKSNKLSGNITTNTLTFEGGLGVLSERFESNGDPGIIAANEGDIGGKSYGAWQIASNVGTMKYFLSWLKSVDKNVYNALNSAYLSDGNRYGSNFDYVWKQIASEQYNHFYKIQWLFIKNTHYDKAVNNLKDKIDINSRSKALQNVLWSTAVQHGPTGAKNIFESTNLNASDRNIIIAVYNERSIVNKHFSSSSDEIKTSVIIRFIYEKEAALKMLDLE